MQLTPLDRRSENVRVPPIVIAELELGEIQRHIFAAHFMERADDTALEDRPETFNGLSVNCADNVLASRMVNGRMREIFVEHAVSGPLICAKQADFMGNGFSHKRIERCGLDVRDHSSHDITFAANCADNWSFAGTDAASSAAAPTLIPMPVLGQSADESFVDFDNSAELINVLHQRGSNLMAHEPSGFIGTETHVTIKLQSAHAFLANEHQMNDAIPIAQRFVRVLENRPGDVGKAVGDTIPAVHTFPLESHGFEFVDVPASATRAANAVWPTARDKVRAARGLIGEQFIELGGRELVNWLGLLVAGHDALLSIESSVA
jgi:hypothetical protein